VTTIYTVPDSPDNPISPAGARWLNRPTTDVGPAAPPPAWCLPDTEPSWDVLTKEYGGGMVCSWSRTFPADLVSADVWIQSDDQIIDGRVVRTAPQIMMYEGDGITPAQARQLAAALLNAADVLDEAL
jgi:hypothetical protein